MSEIKTWEERLPSNYTCGQALTAADAEIAELRAALADAEKGTARYRWIRLRPYWAEENMVSDSDELDAAIDQAMREGGE